MTYTDAQRELIAEAVVALRDGDSARLHEVLEKCAPRSQGELLEVARERLSITTRAPHDGLATEERR